MLIFDGQELPGVDFVINFCDIILDKISVIINTSNNAAQNNVSRAKVQNAVSNNSLIMQIFHVSLRFKTM